MIHLCVDEGGYRIFDTSESLRSKHISQLKFLGFSQSADRSWVFSGENTFRVIDKVVSYLKAQELKFEMDDNLATDFAELEESRIKLSKAMQSGMELKQGDVSRAQAEDFLSFINDELPRRLKPHQIKAALHLLIVQHAANFSVPGAGKTTVVLSVFAWLKKLGVVKSLFVVGPPSCFRPWRDEFVATIGRDPAFEILAGGNLDERHLKYYRPDEQIAELYLTTFQTLQRDVEKAKYLLSRKGVSFFLVVDEAHYIKQQGGSWAQSVLDISPCVERRCVLTGTPFPHSYIDAINIFDALYPRVSPLTDNDKVTLHNFVKTKKQNEAAELLKATINPLFYRVRKVDLNLADQEFLEPTVVSMGEIERLLYDTIRDRIKLQSKKDFFRDLQTTQNLQRGRMIRMRQAISYAGLLASVVDDYDEVLIEQDESLAAKIINYEFLEIPAKIVALLQMIKDLRADGQKVVIWSNFIGTLDLIKHRCDEKGWDAEIICGNTPTEDKYNRDVLTREKIIERFKAEESGLDILIANPAACAESISLHKTCSHAIYYDLSYNCAQYLQSLDRIHRVGGSEEKRSYYHFLQYDRTFENDILENLRRKFQDMSLIIDQDFPVYDLDLGDGDIDAYQRIFG